MNSMKANELWVPGIPAFPSTPKEKEWTDRLIHHASASVAGSQLQMRFKMTAEAAEAAELDLLCEPVFQSLIQRMGWSGGSRTQLLYWNASKEAAEPTGVQIKSDAAVIKALEELNGEPILDFLFEGTFPQKAKDPYLSDLLMKLQFKASHPNPKYAVRLQFGGSKINIAEVTSGPVKAIIDSLYPIVGGEAGKPEDWRIQQLEVAKSIKDLKEQVVQITIWSL
jgi:hypothetical protein